MTRDGQDRRGWFFFYGTLRDPGLLHLVLSRRVPAAAVRIAWLDDHRLQRVRARSYPMIVPLAGARVEGIAVANLNAADVRRLDHYEGEEFRRSTVAVEIAGPGPAVAETYMPRSGLESDPRPWQFHAWRARELATAMRQCRRWMASFPRRAGSF